MVDCLSCKMYIYRNYKQIQASKDEIKDLERAATWEPEHVEERLADHFVGRPNVWVERYKIRGTHMPAAIACEMPACQITVLC